MSDTIKEIVYSLGTSPRPLLCGTLNLFVLVFRITTVHIDLSNMDFHGFLVKDKKLEHTIQGLKCGRQVEGLRTQG